MEFRKVRRALASVAAAAMLAAALPLTLASAEGGARSHGVQYIYTYIYNEDGKTVVAANSCNKDFSQDDKTCEVKVNLGAEYAGSEVTLSLNKRNKVVVDTAVLDDNGCTVFTVLKGKNYTLTLGEVAEAEEAEEEVAEEEAVEEEAVEEAAEEEAAE